MTEDETLVIVWNDIKASFGLDECKGQMLTNFSETSTEFLIKQNLFVGVLEYLQSEMEKRLRNKNSCYIYK